MLQKLLSDKARNIFICSQFAGVILTLLLGKLTAVYFTPQEFGVFNIEFATYTFFFTLLLSPFHQFVKSNLNTLIPKIDISNFYILLLSLSIIMFLLSGITLIFLFSSSYKILVILFLIIPANILFNFSSDFLNITKKLKSFSMLSFGKNLLPLIFLVILFYLNVKYENGSITLWIIQIIGLGLSSLFFLPKIEIQYRKNYHISFRKFLAKYFKFAWPLIILAFWSWINNYVDRYVINYFMDSKNVGIYNANYGLGSKFFLLLSPFFLTLLTPNVYGNGRLVDKKKIIEKYALNYIFVGLFVLVLIYVVKDYIGILLLSEQYTEGFYLIFWVSLGFFFLTLVFLFEAIFYALGKTKIILTSNIISAIINVILNVFLVPVFGLSGAVAATVVSFATHLLIIYFTFRKL